MFLLCKIIVSKLESIIINNYNNNNNTAGKMELIIIKKKVCFTTFKNQTYN